MMMHTSERTNVPRTVIVSKCRWVRELDTAGIFYVAAEKNLAPREKIWIWAVLR